MTLDSGAAPAPAPPTSDRQGAVARRLAFEQHTLDNGLRVILHRDPTLPLVAINLWYHVGSKNERPGRTGFAHLFEHLLFQGSQHVDTNDHFRLVQQAGGNANGSTWFDRTTYHEVLPANQLDLGLWLEADRMGFFLPAITQENLDNQREVVINERRQRIDNQPYGRAFERLHELLYGPDHPYRWPVIGYVEDLENASLEDVRDFFCTFYAPNNAVLTLAGDFENGDALRRVERYFGDIPAAPPVPPVEAPMPRLEGELRETQPDDVKLPRIYMGFHAPPFGHDDWYAADLLATVLSDGKSSLLHHDLVYQRQLAQDVSCFVLPTEEVATFIIAATVRPGTESAFLEQEIDLHLRRLGTEILAPEHLHRSLSQLLTSHNGQLQTLERRADLFSMFATYCDDPDRVNRDLSSYDRLSAEDLQHFAATYLDPSRRVVVTVVPREEAASGDAADSGESR